MWSVGLAGFGAGTDAAAGDGGAQVACGSHIRARRVFRCAGGAGRRFGWRVKYPRTVGAGKVLRLGYGDSRNPNPNPNPNPI